LECSGNDWGKCKRPDRSYRRLGAAEEQGQEQAHTLKICGTYVWCVKCYSYAETKPVNLRLACKGLKTTAGRHAIQQLEKGYTPAMATEDRQKIDGVKTRVTLKASVIGTAADESKLEGRKHAGSFADRLSRSGEEEEPTQRFEAEEVGPRWAQRRDREINAAEALKWQRVAAVLKPGTAMTCTEL
jgi:hypothetical protein